MSRSVRVVFVLVSLQAVLTVGYLLVEHRREAPSPFVVEPLDEAAPTLSVERDGVPLSPQAGPHLVHFWATWCAPCVEELPGLLAASRAEGVPVVAVTDEPWPVVAAWFDGGVPAGVVHDPTGEAARRWKVSGLPDTFVVSEGRLVGRMGGPRDWSSPAARGFLRGELP